MWMPFWTVCQKLQKLIISVDCSNAMIQQDMQGGREFLGSILSRILSLGKGRMCSCGDCPTEDDHKCEGQPLRACSAFASYGNQSPSKYHVILEHKLIPRKFWKSKNNEQKSFPKSSANAAWCIMWYFRELKPGSANFDQLHIRPLLSHLNKKFPEIYALLRTFSSIN